MKLPQRHQLAVRSGGNDTSFVLRAEDCPRPRISTRGCPLRLEVYQRYDRNSRRCAMSRIHPLPRKNRNAPGGRPPGPQLTLGEPSCLPLRTLVTVRRTPRCLACLVKSDSILERKALKRRSAPRPNLISCRIASRQSGSLAMTRRMSKQMTFPDPSHIE